MTEYKYSWWIPTAMLVGHILVFTCIYAEIHSLNCETVMETAWKDACNKFINGAYNELKNTFMILFPICMLFAFTLMFKTREVEISNEKGRVP